MLLIAPCQARTTTSSVLDADALLRLPLSGDCLWRTYLGCVPRAFLPVAGVACLHPVASQFRLTVPPQGGRLTSRRLRPGGRRNKAAGCQGMWSGVEGVDKPVMTPEGHGTRRSWHPKVLAPGQVVREKDENRPAFVGEATEMGDGFNHNGKRELPCRYVQTFGFSAWIVSIMG
jgi:hypothetical protein